MEAVLLSSRRFTGICFVSFFRFGMLIAPASLIVPLVPVVAARALANALAASGFRAGRLFAIAH
ncbi:hypothetical protein [Nitrobacter sp. Nb-311A]|uniref:hypothetical protein n=1 Tax=Nitrobacter sp. Nb-311A TaxID=314253 RepID=UPI00103EFB48|nr:hypothetical protein [Nitrobacter sp. Nb-311A]